MLCRGRSRCSCPGRSFDVIHDISCLQLMRKKSKDTVSKCQRLKVTRGCQHVAFQFSRIFLSSLSSKFECVHICFTEERFPDSDRTMCRFGRVVTGATIEDDGTEGGISQFPTCKRVKTRENPEALACQVPAS